MGTFLPRGRYSSLGVCFPPFQILWLGGDRCLLFLLGHLGLDFSFHQSSPSTGLLHSSLVFEVEASWLLPCAPPRGGFPLVARAPDPVPLPSSLPLPALSVRSPFPQRPICLCASHLGAMRLGLLSGGQTGVAVSMLLLAHRASSVRQGVWDKLLSFLPLWGLSACDASVGVARVLSFHAVTYMWKYGTPSGCRSALRRPLFVSH